MKGNFWLKSTDPRDTAATLDDVEKLFALGGMDRRDFLKTSAMIAAGLIIPIGCSKPKSAESVPVDDVVRLEIPLPPEGTATVGVVRKSDVSEMVYAAIAIAGGLDEIRSGDKVVIKPNLTTGHSFETRVTTHPEVLRAVIRAVKARTDAANVTVAEASSYADPSTLEVASKVGIYDVVLSEGVNWLAFEEDEYVEANSHDFRNLNFMLKIPKSLTDGSFQHFINVPMLKNHEAIKRSDAEYTCCIKNHVGILERDKRLHGGGKGIHLADLGEKVAELNLTVPMHTMNVVDALTVILSGGPASSRMTAVDAGLILASKDRVACDSVALAVLRHYASLHGVDRPYVEKSVWQQAQILRAQQLNLGRDKGDIRVIGDGVDEIDAILARWN
ncbi:MAG: DUF362 domain-containing protein [Actinobacteria bacterium]|nr:DUF362 domain-containing protein [Actinomycetota bacterium]